ncbi:MAG TPA: basic secretory protein-like protein [Isosphaeraceae bacterium]
MSRPIRFLLAILPLSLPVASPGALASEPPGAPVAATIATTLSTAGEQIRQLAFDGDAGTGFVSAEDAGRDDHFTLEFATPVTVTSLSVSTGRPDGGDRLDAGTLQVSADGVTFEDRAPFAAGAARAEPLGRRVRSIRIRPAADRGHPLAIREIAIVSDPPVATFAYPVEFVVDTADAPELNEWAERVARECERAYPMINEELQSDGFTPPRLVSLTLRRRYRGVAMTSGSRITGSVAYFQRHPEDVGAMIHETAHVVQRYRARSNPSWLVEGVADYVRFFKHEPGKLGPINPNSARYDRSYRVTAAFLAYLVDTYDKEIVRTLNRAMRAGRYRESIFEERTGKALPELDAEWRATLRR